jgi:hypothetical protein
MRYILPLLFVFPITAVAQAPSEPSIDFNAAGSSVPGSQSTEGTASVSGRINLPAGWKLSIHTVTIRYAPDGKSSTLNVLLPVKGAEFGAELSLKKGGYQIWAVIDVKDAKGNEKQISGMRRDVTVD